MNPPSYPPPWAGLNKTDPYATVHMLAAGASPGSVTPLGAAVAMLCIEHGLVPKSLNTQERDPQLRAAINGHTHGARVERVLSNSFGFGGSNCSLLFGRAA